MSTEQLSKGVGADRRRHQLVLAAFDQIAAKGLEGLRLRQVAAAVNLDHSTVHHYFPTKEDLIAAVVKYATSQLWPTIQPSGESSDQLLHHLRLMARMMVERPDIFVALGELNLRATRDAAVAEIIDSSDQEWRAAIRSRLDQGSWSALVDPAAGAELIVAAIKGAAFNPGAAADALAQLERLLAGNGRTSSIGE